MSTSLRILFAGTPEFAVPSLDVLAGSIHRVVRVLTQPDRPAGRGRRVRPGPVHACALALGLPVEQPTSLRDGQALARLREASADLVVVVAYGLILPPAVLALPRLGCVNVHASLLPRWRGAAPVQRAILAGDEQTGVSIMRMAEGLDTGPVYLQRSLAIASGDTGGSLSEKLATLGAEALMDALPGIAAGTLVPAPQEDSRACQAPRIQKSEARIEWSKSASELERRVRAFDPWPVCETGFRDARLRIWKASVVSRAVAGSAPPGTIVRAGREGVDVVTGDGTLRLLRLQMPGKRVLDAADFVNAYALQGVVLG